MLSIQTISAQLSFALEDYEQVNKLFSSWKKSGTRASRDQIDVWTYCIVRQLLSDLFRHSTLELNADWDALVDITFAKILKARLSLRNPSCYAIWVRRVCKNQFLNYARSAHLMVRLAEVPTPLHTDAEYELADPVESIQYAVQQAICDLPLYLRETAQMWFVEQRPVHEIASQTGRPQATVYAYLGRIRKRLQVHPALVVYKD